MKKFLSFLMLTLLAASAVQAEEITLCDGEYYSGVVPIYSLWADTEGTIGQMIYPEDMLADMEGGTITEVKFYTLAYYYYMNGQGYPDDPSFYISFDSSLIQLAFKTVDENGFTQAVAYADATPVATTYPTYGDMYLTFVLDEPFDYNGGNLLVEAKVIEGGTWGTTYFYGAYFDNYPNYYAYENNGLIAEIGNFLPMVTFTYDIGTPHEPTDRTMAPVFTGYTIDGVQGYGVIIEPEEPSTIYYRILFPDETWSEWMEYTDELFFTEPDTYRIEAYAIAPDKLPSIVVAYEFTVLPELEQTMAPVFTGYVIDGVQGYGVIIEPEEPSTIYYRILFPDETWSEWMEYTEEIFFTKPGHYIIQAYAVAPGKTASEVIVYEFTVTPPEPEQTAAPVFTGYTIDGVPGFGVTIEPEEPSTIYYRILFPDCEEWSEWMEYTEEIFFTEPGHYRIQAYAIAPGKTASIEIAYEFTVTPSVLEQTAAPSMMGYTLDGLTGYGIIIEPQEECTIYYRVLFPDCEEWSEWMEYTDQLFFTALGRYSVEAYAVAPGKNPSNEIVYEFTVIMFGDVNGDNHVNISDVTSLINILLKGDYVTSADINRDGQITITDVTTLINRLMAPNRATDMQKTISRNTQAIKKNLL